MKKRILSSLILPIALCFVRSLAAGTYPDVSYQPPAGWDGPRFVLSQDYPQTKPADETYPWAAIDFKTHPKEYLAAVIKYCYEGNVGVDFVPQQNTVRKWYHAPWLHYGNKGRGFVHGLTSERASRPLELSATQTQSYRNFAVGFYNDKGGYTLGQVWHDPAAPNTKGVSFPEGTVTFKLLFTTAPATTAPYLTNSPEWVADINHSQNVATIKGNKVRLLQVDVAVKDARSVCGGWVFGTFHYDNAVAGKTPWEKLQPLTLLWGDDPTLTETLAHGGAKPQESWINSASPLVKYRKNATAAQAPKVLGWAGRGNGPVDNPVSSCLSCHSTAQTPVNSKLLPDAASAEAVKLRWFRNLTPGESFDQGTDSLDFSQQLSAGLQNYKDFHKLSGNQGGISNAAPPAARMRPAAEPKPSPEATPAEEFRVSRDPED
jgi:hypothetical protein